MKKIIASVLAGAVALFSMSFPAYAAYHSDETFLGTYIGMSKANLTLYILPSAQTSLYDQSVYSCANYWNNISSNVSVTVIMGTSTPSANTRVVNVTGANLNSTNILGTTTGYTASGKTTMNSNWTYSAIEININPKAYSTTASSAKLEAQHTFIHEVGHALKLKHPIQDSNLVGHNIGGYPYAVMNSGYPDITGKTKTSPRPTWHDQNCLIAKWGE